MPKGRIASLGGLGTKNKAPLVETDKNELGDKRLNPEESVIREREALLKVRRENHAYPNQEYLIDKERSKGGYLSHSDLVLRLKKLNRTILIRESIHPDGKKHWAVFRHKEKWELARDGYDLNCETWRNEHLYVTGFPMADLPEWGHLLCDTDGIAEKEVRGWRSILMALIKQGVFSYASAVAEFGNPSLDQRSDEWFKQLKVHIGEGNGRIGIAQ